MPAAIVAVFIQTSYNKSIHYRNCEIFYVERKDVSAKVHVIIKAKM